MQKSAERIRADRGAALLDEKDPGWYWDSEFDDLSTLYIGSTKDCTLGKRFGSEAIHGTSGYLVGCDFLGLTPGLMSSSPYDHGFCGTKKQTEAWREIITEKREADLSGLSDALEGVRTDEAAEALTAA